MTKNNHWRPDIVKLRERLEEAPDRAILIDQHGDVWQKSKYLGYWYRAFDAPYTSPHELMQNAGKSIIVEASAVRALGGEA